MLSKVYHKILKLLPKSVAHKILYYRMMGKKLNLKNPKDFNEKIQYLIVYKYREKYGKLADKYLVREFIKERGYEKLLPKLYGVYDNANDINFSKLPNKFVLKPNNGSGHIFVCTDKKQFDFEKAKEELNCALKEKFSDVCLEYHYDYIEPKIICEEYLDDKEHKLPLDYKIYAFNGMVDSVFVLSDREHQTKTDSYDKNWNKIDFGNEHSSNQNFLKPKNFDQMIKIAENLSKGFEFVRVDLYNINGKIYFGEMTFSPAAGMLVDINQKALDHLGKYIDVNRVEKE